MFLQTWKEKRGREVRVKKIFIWGEKQNDNGSEWSKKSVELRDSEGSVDITYRETNESIWHFKIEGKKKGWGGLVLFELFWLNFSSKMMAR